MKVAPLILLFAVCYVEARKVYAPINKNANVDFINMESGGVRGKPAVFEPPKPAVPVAPVPTTKPPVAAPAAKPAVPPSVTPAPVGKPSATLPQNPRQPAQSPGQIKPIPVNPSPVANPATTPGPGSVKSLINYYDSQGKGSPIRPYSYSQAVKQG
ncbi:unnamed protein product [Arctia plantaginis]|uniref:Uncharacterized protein n=1 Tax=Arctia plantaginis TaxID=874455 RepID=A0A8S1A821_ARCPL|nr:unnamed protein product [Arctia plantaginis]CAB3256553.1 unnamed protein product [Arctia plantaginis]